jgi:glucosamine kinase
MQLLIADSGSTKTEWTFIEDRIVSHSVFTEGINPNQADEDAIATMLHKSELRKYRADKIHFYGAGCGSDRGKAVLTEALGAIFPSAQTEIETDIIGAARALSAGEKSIVGILGTGASSCVFDGNKITEQRPSLGFIIGDEGSGAVLGKMFVRKLLYGELPDSLMKDFYAEFPIDKDAIIKRVYRDPYPNRFLAAFGEYIGRHRNQASVNEVIRENFTGFIRSHLSGYKDAKIMPIRLTGSIAFHFREELNGLLRWNGFQEAECVQSPMEGLVRFHTR